MRKIVCLVLCLALFGCKSKEEKISELIKEEMFKTLYDFESYEPIETSKIDSAFTTVYKDSLIESNAMKIIAAMELGKELMKKVEGHLSTIEIWGDSYTERARNKVSEAREEANKEMEKLKKINEMLTEYQEGMKNAYKDFCPTFCGWSVTHKFRCKSKGGSFNLGKYQYVFDKDLEKIISTTDLESEDGEKIKSIIDEVLELKD